MSSCVIKRNSKGKITRVLTPSGEVSTLFDKIAGIAAVSDLNKAAEAYMTIYNDKFRSKFGDWTRSVPRNKEAARSISARLSASEWGATYVSQGLVRHKRYGCPGVGQKPWE